MKNVFTIKECRTIVSNVRYHMGLKGWGVGDLAKHSGLGTTALSLFLNNKRYVKLCTLTKIAETLDTTIPKLLEKR